MARQRIFVSENNIKRGIADCPGWCPVARALKAQYPGKTVEVMQDFILLNRREYHMPRSVERFVKRFDAGFTVVPFTFHLTGTYIHHD